MKFDDKYIKLMEEHQITELKYVDWLKKNVKNFKKKFKLSDAYWKIIIELSKIPYVMQDSDSLIIAKIGDIAEKLGTELTHDELSHIFHIVEKMGHLALHIGVHLLQH